MKMSFRYLPLVALTLSLGACKKDEVATVDTTSMANSTPMTSTFDVGDIDMGRHVGADKKISDKTDDFAPGDTIFASLHTKGGSAPAQVMARWTFQDGAVVHEETQSVSGGVDADTEFHITKAGGWPKGTYTVHIMVDGKEVKTKDITVK